MPNKTRTTETDLEELPSLAKSHYASDVKRAKQVQAYDRKLIGKMLKDLGVTREELEKRADADFAQAKAESAQRLKQLRALWASKTKGRGPLRARIAEALGETEVGK